MAKLNKVLIGVVRFIMSFMGTIISLLNKLLLMLALSVLIGAIAGLVVYTHIKPELDESRDKVYDILSGVTSSDFNMPSDTFVYDKDNNIIGEINAGRYTYKSIEDISLNIQNAYISQEDKRFKEHTGVDWISTARAGVSLIKNRGRITQGGSTITQQLIKNTYLTREKTFKRKLIEIMLAPQIERKFSKTQIMEHYCNTNYYGNRCYGVEAACQFYFGTSCSSVSIAQAALLAGLSNAPALYDPLAHPKEALEKRNEIIKNMLANKMISEDDAVTAINEPMKILGIDSESGFETYQSSYAIHCAALELMKKDGFVFRYLYNDKEDFKNYSSSYDKAYTEAVEKIRRGGYKIYTTLDSDIQKIVQEEIDNGLEKFTDTDPETGKYLLQGAGVVVDNESGNVVAIVGGRGTNDAFNRGFLSARQPGSCIKPLLDYAPAFEYGKYYPSKIVNDHEFEDGPSNSGGTYYGLIPVREALNRSLNTVAWQLLHDITPQYALSFLEKMEFRKISYVDNTCDSISIGGFTNGVRIVDMAKGYSTLANNGIYSDNTCIVSMTDSQDAPVIDSVNTKYTQVYDPTTAYMITDVLKGTLKKSYGTGHGLALDNNVPAAAKTGTTNLNKDAWMCGYTKKYSVAIWMGYDTPKPMKNVYGATYSGKIWRNILNRLHSDNPVSDFNVPDGLVMMRYDENGDPLKESAVSYTGGNIPEGYDLFSISAERRYAEKADELYEEELKEQVYSAVKEYLNSAITNVGEYENIESKYNEIINLLYKVDDSHDRTELYDAVNEKYKKLCADKEAAKTDIEIYKRQQEELKQKQIEESQRAAEEEYKNNLRKTRISEFRKYYKAIQELKYRANDDKNLSRLSEILPLLKEYDDYENYKKMYDDAVQVISNLPDYEEYIRMQTMKESGPSAGPSINSEGPLAETIPAKGPSAPN